MQIRNSNIKNELVRASALAAAVKCYIHHSLIDEILTLQKKTDTLRIVGSIYSSLERIQCNTIKLSGEPDNIILKNTIEGDKKSLKGNPNRLTLFYLAGILKLVVRSRILF